jgi:hypothetical protein
VSILYSNTRNNKPLLCLLWLLQTYFSQLLFFFLLQNQVCLHSMHWEFFPDTWSSRRISWYEEWHFTHSAQDWRQLCRVQTIHFRFGCIAGLVFSPLFRRSLGLNVCRVIVTCAISFPSSSSCETPLMDVETRLEYLRPQRILHLNRTRFMTEYRSKEEHYNCCLTLRKTRPCCWPTKESCERHRVYLKWTDMRNSAKLLRFSYKQEPVCDCPLFMCGCYVVLTPQ